MRVPIETIAKWIMDRDQGATTRDIAKEFKLTTRESANTMAAIQRMDRYTTIWVPGNGYPPRSKQCIPGTLHVIAINKPQFVKNPWGAVTATRVNPKGDDADVLMFGSVYEADLAGFCNVAIYGCLNGDAKTHAGYVWTAEFQDTRAVTC